MVDSVFLGNQILSLCIQVWQCAGDSQWALCTYLGLPTGVSSLVCRPSPQASPSPCCVPVLWRLSQKPGDSLKPLTRPRQSWFSNGLSPPPSSVLGLVSVIQCCAATTGLLTPNAVCVCLLAAVYRLLIAYRNHSSDKNRLNFKLFI